MRLVLVAGGGAVAALIAVTACDGDSPGAPSGGTTSTVTVAILGERGAQSYSPNPTAAGGQSVVWRNDNGDTHNITATDGSWETGNILPGAVSRAVAIPQAGTTYFCANHPDTMRGGSISGAGGEPPPPCQGVYCD